MFEIPWVVQRSELYGAGYMPHVRIDGKFAVRGATNCSSAAAAYRAAIQRRLTQTQGLSPIEISGSYLVGADSVRATATYTLLDAVTLTAARGYLLMLVDDLYWAGVYYDHVTVGAHEEDVSLAHPGDMATITAVFARDPVWDADDIHCLAFCQQMSDSLDVYQAAWLTEASSRVADDPASILTVPLRASPCPFLPARGPLTLSVARPLAGAEGSDRAGLGVEILDGLGRQVALAAPPCWNGAAGILRWDGRDAGGHPLPAGSYWARLQAADGGRATRLILVR